MPGLFDRLKGELDAQEKAAGLSMADVLSLPDSLRKLFNWLLKQGDVSLSQVVAFTQQNEADTLKMLAELVEKGFVREIPLKPEHARYLYHFPGAWGTVGNSAYLPKDGWQNPFKPFVWLGDEDRAERAAYDDGQRLDSALDLNIVTGHDLS